MAAISGIQLVSIVISFPRQQCSAAAQALAACFYQTKGGVSVQLPLQDVLQALISLLESSSISSQEAALMTIAAVCQGHSIAGRKLASLGGIPLLVHSLSSPSEICRAHAAEALAVICEGSIANQQQATDLEAVKPLAQMLQSCSAICREKAARTLAVMFRGKPALIPDVLLPLISQLSCSSLDEQIRAAAAISAIGGDSDDSCRGVGEHFAALHGMTPLVALLTTTSDAGLEITAQAICSMHWIMQQDGKVSMAQPESFQVVIHLLNSPEEFPQLQAAAAIIALCEAFMRAGLPHEHAAAEALVKQGALQPLILLLGSSSAACQESAAAAIAALCTWGHAGLELARRDGLQALVDMLGSASTTSQLAALRTIDSICDHAQDRMLMSQFEQLGGLVKITVMLSSSLDTCQAAAATLMRSLCRRGMAQAVAASCGPQLVNLLSHPSNACRSAAALAIKTMFDWITGDLPAHWSMPAVLQPLIHLLGPSSSPDCQSAAVSAVTAVCLRQKRAARAYLAASIGVPHIVQLLKSQSAECQGHAAEAIAVICQGDPAIQQLVIDQDGAELLVSVLTSSSAASQREAAEALAVLCQGHPAISEQTVQSLLALLLSPSEADWQKGAAAIDAVSEQAGATDNILLQKFIQMGGLQALVALLVCTTGRCQRDVARAIHAVYASVMHHTGDNEFLQPSFQLLRHLLSSASPACQERAAAALSILGQTSNAGSRSQRVHWRIASLGDLHPLVALLNSPLAECQARAAEAICGLHQWEGGDWALWVKRGSMPLLVELLQSGDSSCQQNAAAVLRCLDAPMRFLGELQSDACLQSLMALMTSAHSGSCQEAVDLLGSMRRHEQARFIDLGGLPSLAKLLRVSGIGCQRACARALYKLCLLGDSVRDEVCRMEGLKDLIGMLTLPYDGGAAESAAVIAALATGIAHDPQIAVPLMRGAGGSTRTIAPRLQQFQQTAAAALARSSLPNQQRLLDLDALQPLKDMLSRIGSRSRRSQLKGAVQRAADQLVASPSVQ